MKKRIKQDFSYEESNDPWYDRLRAAIIYRACIDYEERLIKYFLEPNDESREKLKPWIDEVENFFKSNWFYDLSDLDPNFLMKQIKEMAKDVVSKKKITLRRHQFVWGLTNKKTGDDKD